MLDAEQHLETILMVYTFLNKLNLVSNQITVSENKSLQLIMEKNDSVGRKFQESELQKSEY